MTILNITLFELAIAALYSKNYDVENEALLDLVLHLKLPRLPLRAIIIRSTMTFGTPGRLIKSLEKH